MVLTSSLRAHGVEMVRAAGLAASLLSIASLGIPSAAQGNMYRGGSSLTGAYGDDIAAPLALYWRFTSTYFGHNPSAPAVADGTVYFASGSRIYAVDETSGAKK